MSIFHVITAEKNIVLIFYYYFCFVFNKCHMHALFVVVYDVKGFSESQLVMA